MLPKAELHLHLEGAASPDLVRRLAARHGMTLPADLFDARGEFAWTNFLHFLKVYDVASTVIKTEQDYRDVTYEYLKACAAEGAIYVELMSSPDHAAQGDDRIQQMRGQLLDLRFVGSFGLGQMCRELLYLGLVLLFAVQKMSTEFLHFGFVPSFGLGEELAVQVLDLRESIRNERINPTHRAGKEIALV